MNNKNRVIRSLLILEMVVFMYLYVCGNNGLQLLSAQTKQLHELEHTIHSLELEIRNIESDIQEWHVYDFHKEKIAREQLQMARKRDKLFYIG